MIVMAQYNYINDDYKIDFDVPEELKDLFEKAEQADAEEHYGTYLAYADGIDVWAKNCYADGAITFEMRKIICRRYTML